MNAARPLREQTAYSSLLTAHHLLPTAHYDSSSGGFTTRTGHDAWRTTASAVEPNRIRPHPVRPCDEITIKSTWHSLATRTISAAASPCTISSSTSKPAHSSHLANFGSSR